MIERMSERFKLLTSSGRRHDRQATLRGALDWSWDLLSAAEQSALAQLSVFEGGFTLEAAEAVIELSDLATPTWAADAVQGLVEKFLVRAVSASRFDLLGSVHDYAAERLGGPTRTPAVTPLALAATVRHARYFSTDGRIALADAAIELSNVVMACRRAVSVPDIELHSQALLRAWECLKRVGPFRAVLDLTQLVDPRAMAGARDRVRHAYVEGSALTLLGRTAAARARFDFALDEMKSIDDDHWRCRIDCASGEQWSASGSTEQASQQLQSALAMAEKLGEEQLMVETLNALGNLALRKGDTNEASCCYGRALRLSSDAATRGALFGNLGEAAQVSGRLADARGHYEDALVLVQTGGHRRWEGNTRCNLGLVYLELGLSAQATAEFEKALDIARCMGYSRLEATVLCNLGVQALKASRITAARCHLDASVQLAITLGDPRMEGQFRTYQGLALLRDGALEGAASSLQRAEEQVRSAGDVVSIGLLCCARSELALGVGDRCFAQSYLSEARRCASEATVEQESELAQALAYLLEKHAEPVQH